MSKKDSIIKVSSVFFAGVIATIAFIQLSGFTGEDKSGDDHYQAYVKDQYKVFSLPVPENLDFAGEKVPLEMSDVQESLDRELLVNTYWHSNTFLMMKRANRWFPVIEPILKEEGVPDDFKYLALIESGFTNVVSPAGASGFWQFMKGTAKDFDLEVSGEVDERYHLEKATKAACKYFHKAHERYGSWSLVAASYNMGTAGVGRQMERQHTDNYWDLLLNSETSRYVYRILAVKEIMRDPGAYGFHLRPVDLYQPYETKVVNIDSSISDLALWAKDQGISYKTLKIHNPWLRESRLTVKEGHSYEIQLPV